ncbi:MAG: hypothetical protein R3E12_09740 [Candidatus Eisenbacteria bacterium]
MRRATLARGIILPVLALIFGCSEGDRQWSTAPGDPQNQSVDDPCGEVTSVRLLAGQTIDVGSVTVENDGTELCVTYETSGDWTLVETHLDIRLTLGDVPQTRSGNPKVGKFTYSHKNLGHATSDEYCFLLEDLGYTAGTDLVIAAHAVVERVVAGQVQQNETAWGEGPEFPGNSWAMYLGHHVQECNDPGPFEEGDFTTYPQSEWGEDCVDGSQASCYLIDHWDGCLGSGEEGGEILVGCPIGGNFVSFTDPYALQDYLPLFNEALQSQPLLQSYFNPVVVADEEGESREGGEGGELLGQVLALTLSLTFDACDPDFGASDLALGDLVVCSDASPFNGMTVSQILHEANNFLGGCGSSFTPDELTAALAAINQSFVPGQSVGSYLCLPEGGNE